MSQILIVDDEPSICWGFQQYLTDDGHVVRTASSAEEALRLVADDPPDAVVLDVRLPGMDGLSAIRQLRARIGAAPIIVITAFGNLETAVRAVAEGAFDYLTKPFDLPHAVAVLERALEAARASAAEPVATPSLPETASLVGTAPVMQQVFKQIALAAAAEVPVLITGESGTGKELVSRAIHRHSRRGAGMFLPVCLAALSPGVVESELFGHVRGSFTGATADRPGLLELATGGTVLLDEIADTSMPLQVKLLRAIEQREITPVGDARPRAIDVRLIAATNRSLPDLIATGGFREDLFFRLSVFHIHLPPLRERRADIPALAEHFLPRMPPTGGGWQLSERFLEALSERHWAGNIRELRNAVEHAAIVARGGALLPEHLPPPYTAAATTATHSPSGLVQQGVAEWVGATWSDAASGDDAGTEGGAVLYEQFLQLVEPPLLQTVLAHCGGNRAAAAQRLGLHRSTLRQKLRRYGIG